MTERNPTKRILAIDFGDRRTGVAATDWTGTIIVPLETFVGLDDAACARAISALADERDSEVVVVGVPYSHDGVVGERARRTLQFVERLRATTPRRVTTVDESMTTDEAHARLKDLGLKAARRKRLADSVAAMVILERFRAIPDG